MTLQIVASMSERQDDVTHRLGSMCVGDQLGSDAGSLGHLNTMTWRNGHGGRHLMPVSPSAFDDDP